MLTKQQQKYYNAFYESTHENEFLDRKTEVMIGLASAMAMDCAPCTQYYFKQAKKAGVSKGEISEVLAKVMAVAAGMKRLQTEEALQAYNINIDDYK